MEAAEFVILSLGGLTLVFSLFMIYIMVKKDQSILKISWLVIIAFLMIGFPFISKAKIFGLEYNKESSLENIKVLAKALSECPENTILKAELKKSLNEIEEKSSDLQPVEVAEISEAYLSAGDTKRAAVLSDSLLKTNPEIKKAQAVSNYIKIDNMIKKLPTTANPENYSKEVAKSISALKVNSNIDQAKVEQLNTRFNSIKGIEIQDK